MRARLTVFFDGSFWVGIFERREGDQLSVGRVVFGPEPSDRQVYELLLRHFPHGVAFGPATADTVGAPELPKNPKRAQREARRAVESGVSRRAWEAMRLTREMNKLEGAMRSKAERDAEAQHRFELKQDKRKKKHRGH